MTSVDPKFITTVFRFAQLAFSFFNLESCYAFACVGRRSAQFLKGRAIH
jgi:hypothetical protein